MSGGRPVHDFWEKGGYERRKEGNKIVAYCIICKKTLSNSAKTRLQTHRNVCRNKTDWSSASQNLQFLEKSISTDDNGNVIERIELENIQATSIEVDAAISASDQRIFKAKVITIGTPDSSEVSLPFGFDDSTVSRQDFSGAVSTPILPYSKKLKIMQPHKRKLYSYIDYISDKEKARINDALVKLFYGCNIPFDVIESKHFLNFINAIRHAAYGPLSTEALSNKILHEFHAELTKHQSTFSYFEGILVITRTEIKQTSHVIGFIQNKKNAIFLKTWNIQKEDNLLPIIKEAITLAKTKFNIIIYAVISNEDLRSFNVDECSKLWILQCNISFVASIEKELIDFEFLEKVRNLLGQFLSKEFKKDLIARGGVAVVLEGNSFYQTRNPFSVCLTNLRAMRQIMGDRQYKVNKDIVNILIDESFEEQLNYSLDLLKPLCSIAENCEKSEITIADITEDWLMLISTENAYYIPFQSRIAAILTPIALVANLLHPIYRGQRFTNDQSHMRKVMEFLIDELDEEGMNEKLTLRRQ